MKYMTDYMNQKIEDIKCLYDLNYRIVRIDKKPCVNTRDFITDRYNFEIENGIIVKQYLG